MPTYRFSTKAAASDSLNGLLITGDPDLVQSASQAFDALGLGLAIAASGTEADAVFRDRSPQFAIIDLTSRIPDLLSEVRRFSEGGVLVLTLTEAGGELDRILSLELGAEDSLSRPFSVREMMARTKVLVRRMVAAPVMDGGDTVFGFAGWTFHAAHRRLITPAGERLVLTFQNSLLLELFLLHPQAPLHADHIAQRLGLDGRDPRIGSKTVSRLRQRLSAYPGGGEMIATLSGSGYVFQKPVIRSVGRPSRRPRAAHPSRSAPSCVDQSALMDR